MNAEEANAAIAANEKGRERWSSRAAFILASMGAAIGFGKFDRPA
jgi:SNF family Na+-dependent transporter